MPISRRRFLRGTGAALALPLLASARPRSAWGDDPVEPLRNVFWYVPNGIPTPEFEPDNQGFGYDLKTVTAPLAAVQADVSIIGGMANLAAEANHSGDHARGTASYLSVETIRHTAGSDIEAGITVDQRLAQHLQGATPLPSLQLGLVPGSNVGDCTGGYSCAYIRNISWAGPSTPLPSISDPGVAFDRLFGVDVGLTPEQRLRRAQLQVTMLDRVRDDANSLRADLGAEDKLKLDEYLTAVRELEQRVQGLGAGTCEAPDRPGPGLPLQEHVTVMQELMVLALHCDLTRVITFMLGSGGSNQTFPFLGIPETHHQLSHHGGDAGNLAKLATISRWEMEQFAALTAALGAVTVADGTRLLDHCLVACSSEIRDGDRHDHRNLPLLLAGTGGGVHDPGRFWVEPDDRSLADLWLAFLHANGLEDDSFGIDGTQPLNLLA